MSLKPSFKKLWILFFSAHDRLLACIIGIDYIDTLCAFVHFFELHFICEPFTHADMQSVHTYLYIMWISLLITLASKQNNGALMRSSGKGRCRTRLAGTTIHSPRSYRPTCGIFTIPYNLIGNWHTALISRTVFVSAQVYREKICKHPTHPDKYSSWRFTCQRNPLVPLHRTGLVNQRGWSCYWKQAAEATSCQLSLKHHGHETAWKLR